MDQETRALYISKSSELRALLKSWENEWAQSHAGSKPGRQDIKDNPQIARKYKEYNKLRDILAGASPPRPPALPHPPSKEAKREVENLVAASPTKKAKPTATPSKPPHRDDGLMNTPAISRKLFSPSSANCLGPTPQRDGRVLGLFDLLVERELGTPSKKRSLSQCHESRQGPDPDAAPTPSARTRTADRDSDERLTGTPISASKRQLFRSTTTTPRRSDGKDGLGAKTPRKSPSSAPILHFETPSFLKRHRSLLPADGGDESMASATTSLRLPRKSLTRGLSEIVAGLRRAEEERLDEDLEALREVEGHELAGAPSKAALSRASPSGGVAERMPAPGETASGVEGGTTSGGATELESSQPATVSYKKKGQKRTTRMANIKPIRVKRPPMEAAAQQQYGGERDDVDELEAEPAGEQEAAETNADAVKRRRRKGQPLAQVNFRRLKLRNSGARGKAGQGSRFRRRR